MLNKTGSIRKLIHFFTGLAIFLLTYLVDKNTLLWLIAGGTLFAFVSYPLKTFYLLHHTSGKSYGTLFYPAGILTAYLILYHLDIDFFRISLLLLTISDTVANITGTLIHRNFSFKITYEEKSLFGIAAFTISAWLILHFLLPGPLYHNLPMVILLLIAFLNFELISFRGSDNLSIPLGSALLFRYAVFQPTETFIYFIFLLAIMSAGTYLLFSLSFLTRLGSLTAYFVGVYLFGFLGFEWGVPVLFFFFTSVIFTKIHGVAMNEKRIHSPRNAWQVLANILPALIVSVLYLISKKPIYIPLYISLIAAVTADTWASEIGPVFSRKCISLSGFTTAAAGISGGISFAGSLASLIAAFSASAFSYYIFYGEVQITVVLLLTVAGFLAGFVDSALGAFWEPRLLRNKLFSKNADTREHISPNDLVNILGSVSAPFIFLLMI